MGVRWMRSRGTWTWTWTWRVGLDGSMSDLGQVGLGGFSLQICALVRMAWRGAVLRFLLYTSLHRRAAGLDWGGWWSGTVCIYPVSVIRYA